MVQILDISCKDLVRRIEIARNSIAGRSYPPELNLCIEWIKESLAFLQEQVKDVQRYSSYNLNDKDINLALFNELCNINNELDVLDSNYIHALHRTSEHDVLALRIISWLHLGHAQTMTKPFLVSNGVFSIAPSQKYPTLYWLPLTSQYSLLHLPLFFHEFGHQLFSVHAPEMMDHIEYFQKKLKEFLQPAVSQNDEKHKEYLAKAMDIVETWTEWMEELFADAVGLTIGGKSYLYAFSYYMRLNGRAEFFVPEKHLARRTHPVTYLRVRFLMKRAQENGLHQEASVIWQEWEKLRELMKVNEDYFGYYRPEYFDDVSDALKNMLAEAAPRPYTSSALNRAEDYPQILDEAWRIFLTNPESFSAWERSKLSQLLEKKETISC